MIRPWLILDEHIYITWYQIDEIPWGAGTLIVAQPANFIFDLTFPIWLMIGSNSYWGNTCYTTLTNHIITQFMNLGPGFSFPKWLVNGPSFGWAGVIRRGQQSYSTRPIATSIVVVLGVLILQNLATSLFSFSSYSLDQFSWFWWDKIYIYIYSPTVAMYYHFWLGIASWFCVISWLGLAIWFWVTCLT